MNTLLTMVIHEETEGKIDNEESKEMKELT
jgi:hypothetical protein